MEGEWCKGGREDELRLCGYWDEPERAPHRRVCCGISLYYILFLVRRAVNHFRLLFCAFLRHSLNSKTIHKLLVLNSARRHQLSSNSKDGDHSWTYLFNGWNDRCYRMARFHLSMPLFVLPLTVEVTRHMDRPLQWPHR